MYFSSLPSTAALVTMFLLSAGTPSTATSTPSRTSSYLARRQNNVLSPSTRYSEQMFIGTHHSAMLRTQSNGFSLSGNQFHNITVQLNAGVRLLHGQIHLPAGTTTNGGNGNRQNTGNRGGDLRICHASCALLDAGLLVAQLTEVANWLKVNRGEVITFLWATPRGGSVALEDVAAAYQRSSLDLLSYTPPHKEMRVQDWPSIEEMVLAGRRVVTFLDTGSAIPAAQQEKATFLLPAQNFLTQTPTDTTKPQDFTCTLGGGGMNPGNKLVLINHLLYEEQPRRSGGGRFPNVTYINQVNSGRELGVNNVGSLLGHVNLCQNTLFTNSRTRTPNFAVVNFFDRGDVFLVQDVFNGVVSAPVELGGVMGASGRGGNRQVPTSGGNGVGGEAGDAERPLSTAEKFITLDQLMLERTKEKEREEFNREVESGRGAAVAIGAPGSNGAGEGQRQVTGGEGGEPVQGGEGEGEGEGVSPVDSLRGVFTFTRTAPPVLRETEGVVNAGASNFGSAASGRVGGSRESVVVGMVVGVVSAVVMGWVL